jgi:hypothetical protein
MVLTGHTAAGHPIFHFEEDKPKMAFDPEQHEIDPKTGYMVDKETGHPVGLVSNPPVAAPVDTVWPKWIKPHDGHLVRKGDHVSTPHFPTFHVQRGTGEVTVLVKTEEEEAFALSDPLNPVKND